MYLAQNWSGGKDVPAQIIDIEVVIAKIIQFSIPAAAIVLFIFIILGGFNLLNSGGDPNKVASAWKTITFAIFGMVLLAAGYLILRFLSAFTGVDITQFNIRN